MTKKISELPAATTPLAGTELVEIVQGGANKQVPASDIGGVQSVNGQTGAVVLDAADVGAVSTVVAGSGVTVDSTDPQNPVISAAGGSSGDVTGPASSTAGHVAVFADATGKEIADAGHPVREVLTSDRTYYVRADGDDSNDGRSNTSGGAFKTIQKAVDVVGALDCSIYQVTVQVGAGTHAGVILPITLGAKPPLLQGDVSTPSNVTISAAGICITAAGAKWSIGGIKVTSSGSSGVFADKGAAITIVGDVEVGAVTTSGIVAQFGATIEVQADLEFSGGAFSAIAALIGGNIYVSGTRTITISGAPTFNAFVRSSRVSSITIPSSTVTITGSATGGRYTVDANAVIHTAGGGASYFPGTVAGSLTTGGQYL